MTQVRSSVGVLAVAVLVVAVALGLTDPSTGLWTGLVGLAAVAAFGAWSLRRGRHTPWAEASPLVAPDRAVVLWKPGCIYCERLLSALRSDGRVIWVNVWRDDEANRVCRDLNGGDELTPTVIVGDLTLRNPSAALVRATLDSAED